MIINAVVNRLLFPALLLIAAHGCSGGGTSGTGVGAAPETYGEIRGSVHDDTGAPETGVNVTVVETGDQAVTDETGNYVIVLTQPPPPNVTVEVTGSAINDTYSVPAPVGEGSAVELDLQP